MDDGKNKKKLHVSSSFLTGVVALVFLAIGYQTALFVHHAVGLKLVSNIDEPDTVFVYIDSSFSPSSSAQTPTAYKSSNTPSGNYPVIRKSSNHSQKAKNVVASHPKRRVENFKFNPNTVSVDDLLRLGFSQKQAKSIDNYRNKGGKFRRKSDFAKSYVVADSIYRRLEAYIDIPLLDLNKADSAAFDTLPGIGGYFAAKMVQHRRALGGYSYKEQLMDIYNFNQKKFDKLSDLICIPEASMSAFSLWTLPVDSLRLHPYIKDYTTARGIVLFRENNPKSKWTIKNLSDAGVLAPEYAEKLSKCLIASP